MRAADFCTTTTKELARSMRRLSIPALVLPNGFDHKTYVASRRAAREGRVLGGDELIRIGYAGGSRTHQRDFALAADAIARVLTNRPNVRLVLFRNSDGTHPILDVKEFPMFRGLENQIEWYNFVPLPELPAILARFDISICPLETGNVFCEAKSELKFFEAALVDVPTVASPTGPYKRAIRDEFTGYLARNPEQWYNCLIRLVDDPLVRRQIARRAHRDILWTFGPLRRSHAVASAVAQFLDGPANAAKAFAFELQLQERIRRDILVPEAEIRYEQNKHDAADVTVVVPLYNYGHYLEEALRSVAQQSLSALDLIVVDDASTDGSLSTAIDWSKSDKERFNRICMLRNKQNSGLGPTRNSGIDAADTAYVLLLDADNRLLPNCASSCLSALRVSNAAFAYPVIQQFSDRTDVIGTKTSNQADLWVGIISMRWFFFPRRHGPD
jgi:hypothetical protein